VTKIDDGGGSKSGRSCRSIKSSARHASATVTSVAADAAERSSSCILRITRRSTSSDSALRSESMSGAPRDTSNSRCRPSRKSLPPSGSPMDHANDSNASWASASRRVFVEELSRRGSCGVARRPTLRREESGGFFVFDECVTDVTQRLANALQESRALRLRIAPQRN